MSSASFPRVRPRRLRESAALRRLVSETRLDPADLVLPVFVREGASDDQLRNAIVAVWAQRADRYSEIRTAATRTSKVEMSYIGG